MISQAIRELCNFIYFYIHMYVCMYMSHINEFCCAIKTSQGLQNLSQKKTNVAFFFAGILLA